MAGTIHFRPNDQTRTQIAELRRALAEGDPLARDVTASDVLRLAVAELHRSRFVEPVSGNPKKKAK